MMAGTVRSVYGPLGPSLLESWELPSQPDSLTTMHFRCGSCHSTMVVEIPFPQRTNALVDQGGLRFTRTSNGFDQRKCASRMLCGTRLASSDDVSAFSRVLSNPQRIEMTWLLLSTPCVKTGFVPKLLSCLGRDKSEGW